MQQEIVINAISEEIRVAILENGLLTELYIEERDRRHLRSNIYKGRVTRVLPGMQAAFVDIGLSKDSFLYVLDFYDNIEKYEMDEDEPFAAENGEVNGGSNGSDTANSNKSEIEIEAAEALPSASAKEIDDKNKPVTIESKLKTGQEIIVQIAKEPMGTKGARVTSHISLPGRYLVYMPTVEHVGVSRRITSAAERSRLRDIIKKNKPPNCGFIVRTAGEGKDEEHFKNDIEFLTKLWGQIVEKSEKKKAPSLLHRDLDVVFRSIRDIFSADVDRVMIDSEEQFTRCVEFVNSLLPKLTDRVKLYLKSKPIFDYYNIESQIEKALKRKVWLKSGGYIVIDETEALVSIDVNTGKYVGKKNLEETIFKINLEAIHTIVNQVRLRDLGGIIIIDFIDMKEEKHRQQLMKTLDEALKVDRTRTNVLQLTDLGLVEMTRKRARQSLGKILSQPCPCCKGNGRIKSPQTIYYTMQRDLIRLREDKKREDILLRVHPDVASLLYENGKQRLRKLEKICNKRIVVKSDDTLHQEEYDLVSN